MSSRLLSLLSTARSSCRIPNSSAFHSSVVAAATRTKSFKAPHKNSTKTRSNTQFKSTSRTRLVKDLRPKDSKGKYEVAKPAPSRQGVKPEETSESHNKPADQKAAIEALLDEEFDRSSPPSTETLPSTFASPPLLPTLSQSIADVLGPDATPTPIQALSLKRLFPLSRGSRPGTWKEFLLASETGSGKSIAYLLPLLQYLKQTEESATNPPSRLPLNPRAIVLAPTHELTRQLAGFAKSLVHLTKLRVLCASRANVRSTDGGRSGGDGTTARQMKHVLDSLIYDTPEDQLEVQPQSANSGAARSVDVLVSTPVKALEMVRGWGWNKVGTEEWEREEKKFRPGKPEMGLKRVECVVIDEADILFDPDFRETTLNLLSDISAARGHPVRSDAHTIAYPFHLILTSATIPTSLSTYLSTSHPSLIRLASPHLHRLPATLHTEHVAWSGGNRFADIERRLRRVWAEDALRGPDRSTGRTGRSRVLVFCNRSTSVSALGAHLSERGIPNVTLTSTAPSRARGSNRHLAGFLKGSPAHSEDKGPGSDKDKDKDKDKDASNPHVLITTSLLSRGLDFSPSVQHVFIVDSPRNMIDFLHRAGRSGRAGEQGRVVVFGKLKGRGSKVDVEVKGRMRALSQR